MNELSQSVFPKALQQVYYPSYFTNKKTRHREADGFVQSPKARKQQRWHANPAVAPNAPGSISSSSCLQTEASSFTLPVFLFLASPHGMQDSLTRSQTCIPCLARQILNHWTIREVVGTILESDLSSKKYSEFEMLNFY